MLLAEMEDSHLNNSIQYVTRRIKGGKYTTNLGIRTLSKLSKELRRREAERARVEADSTPEVRQHHGRLFKED